MPPFAGTTFALAKDPDSDCYSNKCASPAKGLAHSMYNAANYTLFLVLFASSK
jgi:hypothetical protein